MRIERSAGLRDANRLAIVELIRDRGSLSRADIARLSGLSPSTVTAITADLIVEGLLVEDRQSHGSEGQAPVGRPATPLRLDPKAGHAVGIKLGPDSLTATVTDLDAEPLAMARVPHGPSPDAETTVRAFRDLSLIHI